MPEMCGYTPMTSYKSANEPGIIVKVSNFGQWPLQGADFHVAEMVRYSKIVIVAIRGPTYF